MIHAHYMSIETVDCITGRLAIEQYLEKVEWIRPHQHTNKEEDESITVPTWRSENNRSIIIYHHNYYY